MEITESDVRESYREQACLSQAHRWLAGCLMDPSRVEAEGLPACVVDAHGATPSVERGSKHVTVRFDAPYVRRTDDAEPCAALIEVRFATSDETLPPIEGVEVLEQGPAESVEALPQATSSRLLGLKHRWHALVEHPVKTPEAFREIVSGEFVMDWGEGSVKGFDALEEWVTGTAATVSAARHDLAHFSWEPAGDGRFTAEFTFVWAGYSRRERRMAARSRHVWRVLDDPAARFPRIDRMDVEFLEPFHVVE